MQSRAAVAPRRHVHVLRRVAVSFSATQTLEQVPVPDPNI